MISQSSFRAALLDAASNVPEGLIDGAGQPAGRRYDVYRNNVAHSLIEAMKTAFPLVRKLIGEKNFDGLAAQFIRRHPPRSPVMMFYGDEFPEFLKGTTALSQIGYLPDTAHLDLAMRSSYHAANAAPYDPTPLAQMDPEALIQEEFTIAPATRILRSCWPLFDIWRFNTRHGAPKPQAVAQDVLITRPDFDPVPYLLPPGGADWLEALRSGQPLGMATDTAIARQPEFDLNACLGLALTTRTFSSPSVKS